MSEGPAIGAPPAYQAGAVPSAVTSQPSESTFELLITVIHPSKRVRTPNRKTKNSKAVSEDKGPLDIPIEVGWVDFLDIVAEKLAVQRSDLIVTSLMWHWYKPASGPWLPVQDQNGFMSMIKKIEVKSVKSEPFVIVRMQAPATLQKQAAGLSGNAWDAQAEDEPFSDFEDGSIAKKVRVSHHLSLCCTQFLTGKARRRARRDCHETH
jgi:hypothetical protein